MDGKWLSVLCGGAALVAPSLTTSPAAAADSIFVGALMDLSGPTSGVGKVYSQGILDSVAWINANGGINGTEIELDAIDYSYKASQAISAYKRWTSRGDLAVIQGWGTADTEALVKFIARDEIPYFSASYSGHLTDPTGMGPDTKVPAPYNFFYGPSYSDACRGLVQWAASDWQEKGGGDGGDGAPKFVHMGDNHPFPNAPKKACRLYAEELGFEVLNPIVYSLQPGDFKAQCLILKDSGANYAFLSNTSGSNISIFKSCATVGVDVQFMANVWGYDENVQEVAGDDGDGIVWVVGASTWNDDVPGMALVRDISKMSDPSGEKARHIHYMRGVCSTFYMKEALEWADDNGGITGANVKLALESRTGWVPNGLDGVCLPATWTDTDHRGVNAFFVYRGTVDGAVQEMTKIYSGEIERRPEWLGM